METIDYFGIAAFIAVSIAMCVYMVRAVAAPTRLLIAVDVSPSARYGLPVTPDDIVAAAVDGRADITWLAFTTEAVEFDPADGLPDLAPADTDFRSVQTFVEDPANGGFDWIVVITDGFAAPIRPRDGFRWEWWTDQQLAPNWLDDTSMSHRYIGDVVTPVAA
jgi:hypothetical protein